MHVAFFDKVRHLHLSARRSWASPNPNLTSTRIALAASAIQAVVPQVQARSLSPRSPHRGSLPGASASPPLVFHPSRRRRTPSPCQEALAPPASILSCWCGSSTPHFEGELPTTFTCRSIRRWPQKASRFRMASRIFTSKSCRPLSRPLRLETQIREHAP